MKYNISKEELTEKYINQNYTTAQCSEFFGCSRKTIVDRIGEYGIYKTLVCQGMDMTDEMYEVLRGALLGDGSLLIEKGGINANFQYSSRSLQHVEFIKKYFEKYKVGKGIYVREYFDKRTNKIYKTNRFVTKRSPILTEEMNKWYVDKIKHIPMDLVLTPLMCLVWYIGDGCLTHNNINGNQTIQLATNCFTKAEIEDILLPQLSRFDAKICKAGFGKDGERHYTIKIYRKENVIAFLDYIGECPFDDYKYKWDVKPSLLKNYAQYDKEWIELYNLNFASTKIGLLYNCPAATVIRRLKLNGIQIEDARNKGLFPPCLSWEELINDGYDINYISQQYGCSFEIINRYFDYIKVHGNQEFLYDNYKQFREIYS